MIFNTLILYFIVIPRDIVVMSVECKVHFIGNVSLHTCMHTHIGNVSLATSMHTHRQFKGAIEAFRAETGSHARGTRSRRSRPLNSSGALIYRSFH